MDWISITTGCFAVSNAVTKTALDLNRFVRDVRESRADLASLSAELHALDGVLDLLKDDAASASFPKDLSRQTPAVVAGSGAIVAELDVIFGGEKDNIRDKRSRWLAMQQHVDESRVVLEVYRLTLGLALDLVALNPDETPIASAKASDLSRILAEIGHLRTRVRSDVTDDDNAFILQNYLNILQRHTQAAATEADAEREPEPELAPEPDPEPEPQPEVELEVEEDVEDKVDRNSIDLDEFDTAPPEPMYARNEAAASPIGKAPDSAVDMMDDEGENEPQAEPSQSQETQETQETQENQSSSLAFAAPTAASSSYSLSRQRSPSLPQPPPPPPPRGRINGPALLPSCEINDLMDELREELPSRPPTPPPKAVSRGSSALGFYGPPSNGSSPTSSRPAPNALTPFNTNTTLGHQPMTGDERNGLVNSINNSRFLPPAPQPRLTTAASAGQLNRSMAIQPLAPANNSSNDQQTRFGRFLRHIRSNSASTPADLDRRPATATGDVSVSAFAPTPLHDIVSNNSSFSASSNNSNNSSNSIGTIGNTGAVADRRASRRFSASFRTPWALTTTVQAGGDDVDSHNNGNDKNASAAKQSKKKWGDKVDDEPDAVFGVSLRKSVHVANSSARTHHSGSHGDSRREFPLCIFKCYTFIRANNGLYTPDIFGGGVPGVVDAESLDIVNLDRVRALREHFSMPPLYGADLDDMSSAIVIESGSGAVLSHHGYSRHDAAALILQYLEALPRPLVSEAVARRWVTLSRQATISGSYAKRLDMCIDFWEEALGGVRGPARSLLKLLLNLWGDIADASERNNMTAERLAGRVLRPLMHVDGGRNETDYMLSLAFIIRKRSEYALLLRGGGRKSNAAFEA